MDKVVVNFIQSYNLEFEAIKPTKTDKTMEELARKLNRLRQDLAISQRYNYVAINSNVKTFTECIITFDELLNEMEEIIYPDLVVKDLND